MRKTITVIVHVLSVLLFTVAFTALYISNTGDAGISWVSSGNYEDSPQFSDAVNTDIGNLRRLAVYAYAFGSIPSITDEDDEAEIIVYATDGEKELEYTAAELVEEAASFGYLLDISTGQITVTDTVDPEAVNSNIRVAEKKYDPDFLKDVDPGPSQGMMTLRDLSVEVVKAISEYISLNASYLGGSSNFQFNLYEDDGEDFCISLTNTESRSDALLKYGRYLHANGTEVITNIIPSPESAVLPNASSEEAIYELYIGIDTEYPHEDKYRAAADSFEGTVRKAYTWIGAGIVSFIIAVITLILILGGGRDGAVHFTDRLPIEALTAVLAVLAVIFYFLYKVTLGKALESLSPAQYEGLIRSEAKTLITYGMIVIILRSGFRKYKAGTLYSTSLFNRLERNIEDYLENAGAAASAFFRYAIFVAANLALVFFATTLYIHREESPRYILISSVLVTVLILMDAMMYHRFYNGERQRNMIDDALKTISSGETEVKLPEEEFSGSGLQAARSINNISVGLTSVVRDQVKSERLKADLITNVSHDLKTPLTSIITYVDLLKRENIQNEKAAEYLDILERKSQRLKNLTEDLVEASKASSGNIKMDMTVLDIVELSIQAAGEFEDRFAKRGLEFCFEAPNEPFMVHADGRHLWRVFENLFNNAAKYSLENTRVYGEVTRKQGPAGAAFCVFTIKNISQTKLNISPEELTERFVRGDVSRTTEGSGLGLSIAQSLCKLMGGELKIEIDGDLYKASVILPAYETTGTEQLSVSG